MMYWINNWRDLQEPIEYIHGKYCDGAASGEYLPRNIYGYSVSLGAAMLARYVISTGERCVLKGVLLYGLFINIKDNVSFFRRAALKLYDKLVGFNYYLILKAHENEFYQHLGDERARALMQAFAQYKWSLMDISEKVLAPFFGYETLDSYYKDC
jgi:predicted alpha/beta-fold hydrolase